MTSSGSRPVPGQLVAAHLLGVDHIGVAVADLDSGVAAYRDLLGLVETGREENAAQGVVEAMLVPAQSAPAALASPVALQVLAPLGTDSVLRTFLDRRGPGVHHLAYRVDDIDAVLAILAAADVRVLHPAPGAGTGGSRIAFVHPRDAGGVLIELVERQS